MPDQEHDGEPQPFHLEGGNIVFDTPPNEREARRKKREDEQHEFARSQVATNRRIAWFTGALVIATVCTIAVGIWQARISQRSANAARDAVKVAGDTLDATQKANAQQTIDNAAAAVRAKAVADASDKQASKSLEAAIANFHQDQRAWLGVNKPEGVPRDTGPYDVKIPAKNTGRTPAVDIAMYFEIKLIFQPGLPIAIPAFPGPPQPLGTIVPGDIYTFVYHQVDGLRGVIASNPNGVFAIYGGITYKDVFKNAHWLTFCFFVEEDGISHYCQAGNDIGDGPPPSKLPA
jgi:hypothetical protein